jgi:YVTN family beta-propeller protein
MTEHLSVLNKDEDTISIVNLTTNFDVKTENVTNHIPVGTGPEGVAVHPNGRHLYVANQGDNTLFVIDTETYELLYKRRVGDVPVRLVFSPNGRYALIANRESGDVSIIETEQHINGQTSPLEIKRLPVGVWAGGIVLNGEGSYAYVANNKTNDVSIINMNTLIEEGRIEVGIHPDGIAYLKR